MDPKDHLVQVFLSVDPQRTFSSIAQEPELSLGGRGTQVSFVIIIILIIIIIIIIQFFVMYVSSQQLACL
jgi:hypothetical protein